MMRNNAAHICSSAALRPEVKKPGLLEQRLTGDELEDEVLHNFRRPADIYLPNWDLGSPAALDFAITSGMRGDCLAMTVEDGGAAVKNYETKQRTHLETETQCRAQGIVLLP